VKELEDKLGRFKSAGRLKSDESGAPPAPKKVEKPSDDSHFSMRPGDALDAIRDQILQEKARANQ
jgi:hypothetical protein